MKNLLDLRGVCTQLLYNSQESSQLPFQKHKFQANSQGEDSRVTLYMQITRILGQSLNVIGSNFRNDALCGVL